jgi:PAS domain S-box-containing protein
MLSKKNMSISSVFRRNMTIVAVLSTFLIGSLWVYSDITRYNKESETLKIESLESQRHLLKTEVESIIDFIDYQKSQAEKRLQQSIKNRVHEAHELAMHIYSENKGQMDMDDIKKMVKDALRVIRFNNGRGYYFAKGLDGVEQLSAEKPALEGKNVLEMRDSDGRFVVKDMIKIAQDHKEGFYRYNWEKPGAKGGHYPKIAFIKYLEPFDWFIGTGEYLEDVIKDIQQEVLAYFDQIRFGMERYVFAGQWDGLSLAGPQKGTNMYDVKDVNGLAVVQELIAASKTSGGFVNYVMPAINGEKSAVKMSYVQGVSDWQWYVGSGILVEEIDEVIIQKGTVLRNAIIAHIFKIVLMLLGLLVFIVLIERVVSSRIKKSIETFSLFFDKAATKSMKIEGDAVHYSEFLGMAESANEMIDKRNWSEEALKKSETTLRSIFSAAPIGIGLLSNQVIKQVNDSWCNMLGYAKDELFEQNAGILYEEPEAFDRVARETEAQIKRNGAGTIETQWKCKDGSIIDVLLSYAVVDAKDASVVTFTALDISSQKVVEADRMRLEAMLQQAQKMEAIGTLAGGIAHDFNNILSPILIQTEMALLDLPSDSPLRLNMEDVLEAGNRARELVKRILAFSRQSEEELSPIKASSVVKESLRLLRATLPTTIEITQSLEAESDLILADATQIHQVLMNLFTNAFQALPEKGGLLWVGLDRLELDDADVMVIPDLTPGSYLRLTVSDNGMGMDRATMDRIFDPYFTSREKGEGTGMGLAVTHGIVKSYGGAITVKSERGKGASFEVYLPCIERKGSLETEGVKPLPTGNEKILLVDDEKAITDAIQQVLERLGYQVVARTSSVEAFEVFRSRPGEFDLVITDQTMPGMTGEEFAKKLMALRSDIPIILCTGFSHIINEEKAKAIGIRKFIMKPVVMREMALTIRDVLDM